jgi:hypothetical protein
VCIYFIFFFFFSVLSNMAFSSQHAPGHGAAGGASSQSANLVARSKRNEQQLAALLRGFTIDTQKCIEQDMIVQQLVDSRLHSPIRGGPNTATTTTAAGGAGNSSMTDSYPAHHVRTDSDVSVSSAHSSLDRHRPAALHVSSRASQVTAAPIHVMELDRQQSDPGPTGTAVAAGSGFNIAVSPASPKKRREVVPKSHLFHFAGEETEPDTTVGAESPKSANEWTLKNDFHFNVQPPSPRPEDDGSTDLHSPNLFHFVDEPVEDECGITEIVVASTEQQSAASMSTAKLDSPTSAAYRTSGTTSSRRQSVAREMETYKSNQDQEMTVFRNSQAPRQMQTFKNHSVSHSAQPEDASDAGDWMNGNSLEVTNGNDSFSQSLAAFDTPSDKLQRSTSYKIVFHGTHDE